MESEERAQLDAEWAKLNALRAELELEKKQFEAEREASGIEFKVFAGNLGLEASEETIKKIFEVYGPVKEVIILKDREGKSKRSCFVKYYTKAAADLSISALNERIKDEGSIKAMVVRYAERKQKERASVFNTTPYPYPYPYPTADPSVAYTPTPTSYVQTPTPTPSSYASPASAFGQTPSAFGQATFGPMLTPTTYTAYTPTPYPPPTPTSIPAPGTSMILNGSFGARPVRGPNGSNLYVSNLGTSSEADVRTMFGDYGTILSISLFPQGYGFVSYDNAQSAQNAIAALNGMLSIDGTKRLEVAIKKEK